MKKITLLLVISFISTSAFSMRYLVQTGATGGASWRTPSVEETLVDLTVNGQSLDAWLTATSFASGDEVWIAKGTYLFLNTYLYPTAGLSLYGGFAGTETAASDRTIGSVKWDFINETIIDGQDLKRIITPSGDRPNTIVDGITFTRGNGAEGPFKLARLMTVRNCKFLNNQTTTSGGAVINFGGDVISCYFKGNHGSFGGAMQIFSTNVEDIITVSDCVFEDNHADNSIDPTKGNQGGAVRVQGIKGKVYIDKCKFINNSALLNGSAIYNLAATEVENNCTISNCLIYGNTTKHALYLYGGTVYNCTVVNNRTGGAFVGGAAITANIYNTVFWGATNSGKIDVVANHSNLSVQNSAYQVLATGATGPLNINNIVLDANNSGTDLLAYYPSFADPTNNNWHLSKGSALIDAGQTISSVTSDILGNGRPYGTKYDIGAYEFDSTATNVHSLIDYNFTYFSTNNKLELRGVSLNIPIKIYNLSGSIVKSMVSNSKDISIDIEKGIYILNLGGQTVKVVVR